MRKMQHSWAEKGDFISVDTERRRLSNQGVLMEKKVSKWNTMWGGVGERGGEREREWEVSPVKDAHTQSVLWGQHLISGEWQCTFRPGCCDVTGPSLRFSHVWVQVQGTLSESRRPRCRRSHRTPAPLAQALWETEIDGDRWPVVGERHCGSCMCLRVMCVLYVLSCSSQISLGDSDTKFLLETETPGECFRELALDVGLVFWSVQVLFMVFWRAF